MQLISGGLLFEAIQCVLENCSSFKFEFNSSVEVLLNEVGLQFFHRGLRLEVVPPGSFNVAVQQMLPDVSADAGPATIHRVLEHCSSLKFECNSSVVALAEFI